MSRLRRIGLVLLVLAVVAIAWEPTRVGLQTAVLLPNLLGAGLQAALPLQRSATAIGRRVPARPRRWRTGAGRAVAAGVGIARSQGRGDPSRARGEQRRPQPSGRRSRRGRHGAQRRHRARPGLARAARGTAGGRRDRRRRRAFGLLASRPEVDPQRVGIAGFSVGGSLAVLAAADPRIAERVRFVNAFGAFGDA